LFSLHVEDRSAQNKADFKGSSGDKSLTRIGHNRRDSTKAVYLKFIASQLPTPRATNSISALSQRQRHSKKLRPSSIKEFGATDQKSSRPSWWREYRQQLGLEERK
jgi:hypothetical protein